MTLLTVWNNPTGTETNLLVDEITRTWSNPRSLKFLIPQLDPEPSLPCGYRTEIRGYTLKSRTTHNTTQVDNQRVSIPDSKKCPKLVFTEGTSWYLALPMRAVKPYVFHPWACCKVPGNCGMILGISNVKGSYAR
jgi:hypothetical protein